MTGEMITNVLIETKEIASAFLKRIVKLDCYLPTAVTSSEEMTLLLINDGQDMAALGLLPMLESLYSSGQISPIFCVGIYAGEDRKLEYGTASYPDYKGRGVKAELYTRFIREELLPFIRSEYMVESFKEISFAGFSLGGLSALDIVWNCRDQFKTVGVFSGALWWRSKSEEDGYDEETDRIMHHLIREGSFAPGLKFFFQTGTEDETADRNNNGIIDSIDDTLALIEELQKKGYRMEKDIIYRELAGGKHDVPTWGLAMPYFLKWAFGNSKFH